MALLDTLIDSRTLAAIASSGSSTFAHSLGGAPDFVLFEATTGAVGTGAQSMSSNGGPAVLAYAADATNVTVFNIGSQNSDVVRAISFRAHSIIR